MSGLSSRNRTPVAEIAEYTYSYDAALRQLNIKPETLTITEESDSEKGFNENYNYLNSEI